LKRSLYGHLVQVKLLLFTFYLNGGLHAASIGIPLEQMPNIWTVVLKTKSKPNLCFLHIPTIYTVIQNSECTFWIEKIDANLLTAHIFTTSKSICLISAK